MRRRIPLGVAMALLAGCSSSAPHHIGPSRPAEPLPSPTETRSSATPATKGSTPKPSATASRHTVRPSDFYPTSIAFFDSRTGLVGGYPQCKGCRGRLERTTDGGRTWKAVHRALGGISVTIAPGGTAWAVTRRPGRLLESVDRGKTWRAVHRDRLLLPSFGSALIGFAIAPAGKLEPAPILKTTDSGRTWRRIGDPCTDAGAGGSADISFPTPLRGWLLCAGEPSAGAQMAALLETTDGGDTWEPVNGNWDAGHAGDRTIGAGGYPSAIFFRSDGHGWFGLSYESVILATSDAGRTWNPFLSCDWGYSAGPMWFPSNDAGFALVYGDGIDQLLRTRDAGRSWQVLQSWDHCGAGCGKTGDRRTERALCFPPKRG